MAVKGLCSAKKKKRHLDQNMLQFREVTPSVLSFPACIGNTEIKNTLGWLCFVIG